MKTFRQYIQESTDKNRHLEHLEDLIFDRGVEGAKSACGFLVGLTDMLSGSSKTPLNLMVKWDGSPSIVCGTNPENGKFFVATKSAFNKNPKINYSEADIELNHPSSVADVLKVCLSNLSKLNITGVLQGDLLYLKQDIKIAEHGGQKLITFKRNTITYAVPHESRMGQDILSSNLGIVFHTTYTGSTIQSLRASYGADVSSLKSTHVWVTDASFNDVSGASTMTKEETAYATKRVSEIKAVVNMLDASLIDSIVSNGTLKSLIKQYINSKVKDGQSIEGTKSYANGLVAFVSGRYANQIKNLKTERGKSNKHQHMVNTLSFIQENGQQFVLLFMLAALIADVKGLLISKLQKVESIGTFLETSDGFTVTAPEGFVAVDHIGNVIKLVDRLEFSRANFTMDRSW